MLLDFSVPPLIVQTLEDFATTTEGGAAVFVCGARALLTMAEDLPAGALCLTGTRLEELAFTAADVAIKGTMFMSADGASYQATFVLTACCEIFAALARERLRVLALSANSNEQLIALLKAGHVARAARVAADALARYPRHLGLASAALQMASGILRQASGSMASLSGRPVDVNVRVLVDGRSVRAGLIQNGFAREYYGDAKQSWCN